MKNIRAAMALAGLDAASARAVYINDVRARRVHYTTLLEIGWEEVEAEMGAAVAADGRDVLWSGGRALALKHEVRQRLVAEAAAKARSKATADKPADKPGESLTSVLCPACRGVMAKHPICPNCSKGRDGFKVLCTCVECGHEVHL